MPRKQTTSKNTKTTKAKLAKKTAPKKKLTTLAKSKSSAKSRTKLTARATPKTKLTTRTRAKKVTSPKTEAKRKVTPKLKAKTKLMTETKPLSKKLQRIINLTDFQKAELLVMIEKMVNLRKGTREGLRSFDEIDRILDKFNQRYTNIPAKFEAILKFSKEKDPRILHDHVFIAIKNKDEAAIELYTLLCLLAEGKINFDYAKEKILSLFNKTLEIKNKFNEIEKSAF